MSDALSHRKPRARHTATPRPETGASQPDEAFALWGAYFWALSTARHTLGHQLRSPTASFGIYPTLIGEYAALPEPRLEKIRQYADVMTQELERLKLVLDRGIDQLRSAVEPGESRPGMSSVMADLEWLMKPLATKREYLWELQGLDGNAAGDDIPLPGDPIAIHHGLFVLLTLAILDLSAKGDGVHVTISRAGGVACLAVRDTRHDGSPGLAGWFPTAETTVGPPGILPIALRALEQQGMRWDAPTSPGEPIVLRWHLEDTET
jgi:hypothetical protein